MARMGERRRVEIWHIWERAEEWRYGTYGREENGDVTCRRERRRMEMWRVGETGEEWRCGK